MGHNYLDFLHFAFADYRFERNRDIMLVPAHHAVAGSAGRFSGLYQSFESGELPVFNCLYPAGDTVGCHH
jgi:hypothetical protein